MEMKEEWAAQVIYAIEKDDLALMEMMEEYIDYENDWIIDLGCSNHVIDDHIGVMEVGGS